jgi:hypothetical protein
VALVLLAITFAGVLAGCSTHKRPSPAALSLQREDLTAVIRALERAEGPVSREVTATKTAWPLVVNGLPAEISSTARSRIAAAVQSAAMIKLPALFEEAQAAGLTGPAAELTGLLRNYLALSTRGWRLISAAVEEIEHGSPASARFARANVALYMDSVYDGHFILAQIGKQALDAYRKLGGPAAFGASLAQLEIDRLAQVYSEATDRLHPHTGVRLGS